MGDNIFGDAYKAVKPQDNASGFGDVLGKPPAGEQGSGLPNEHRKLRVVVPHAAEQSLTPASPAAPAKPIAAEVKTQEVKPIAAVAPVKEPPAKKDEFVAQPHEDSPGTQLAGLVERFGPIAAAAYALNKYHGKISGDHAAHVSDANNLLTEGRRLEIIGTRDALSPEIKAAREFVHGHLVQLQLDNPTLLESVKVGPPDKKVTLIKPRANAEIPAHIQDTLFRRDALDHAAQTVNGTAFKDGVGISKNRLALGSASRITDNPYLATSVDTERLTNFTNTVRAAHIEADAEATRITRLTGPKVLKAAGIFGAAQAVNYAVTDQFVFRGQKPGAFSIGADIGSTLVLTTRMPLLAKLGIMTGSHVIGRFLDYRASLNNEADCKNYDSSWCNK